MGEEAFEKAKVLRFYKREDIQSAILKNAEGREVAVRFGDRGFGKRPDVLRYGRDILEFAISGATSFHISEERWLNPLQLSTDMAKGEQDELRTGWDLIIDIDSPDLEYSKLTASLIIGFLRHCGIKSISCKFSGNRGFHVAIPFEAFPERIGGSLTKRLFPEAPRRVAHYIQEKIKNHLSDIIIEKEGGNFERIAKKVGAEKKEEVRRFDKNGRFVVDVDRFIEMDTLLISSRHLYRSVYSLNEKSGLASIPVEPEKITAFRKEDARPEAIGKVAGSFLESAKADQKECLALFTEAFDFKPVSEADSSPKIGGALPEIDIPGRAIPATVFPPCVLNIFKGLKDGKKRALFILTNFLKCCGWGNDEIKECIEKWNQANPEKLRQNIIHSHLRNKLVRGKPILPPNCSNPIYKELLVCMPDGLCERVKNPVQYAKKKSLHGVKDVEKEKREPKRGKD